MTNGNIKTSDLKSLKTITRWEDIEVGSKYHMPPLSYNRRFDFIVVSKNRDYLTYKKLSDVDNFFSNYYVIYKNDVKSKFIVKLKYGNNS